MKKGILYAVLASVLWAIVNPFIKQGLSYDFSPMNFAGLRFTVVGIILFAYTWHRGMWREIMQHRRLFGNLILINMFMGYTAFYFGVDFVSGAISSIVMGLTPLINVLLAHLVASNDRLNRYKVVSLAVSLAGLLLIVGTGSDGSPLDWRGIGGIVLLLACILFQGYSAISVSEDKGKVDPIFLNAVQMFFGGLLIYGVGGAAEGFHPFWAKPVGFYASLGVLVFISVFAFSFWFMALRTEGTKVSDINMCRLINPVLGAVLSWIMLPGEYPDFSTVAGMAVIVSSLVIYFRARRSCNGGGCAGIDAKRTVPRKERSVFFEAAAAVSPCRICGSMLSHTPAGRAAQGSGVSGGLTASIPECPRRGSPHAMLRTRHRCARRREGPPGSIRCP